MADKYKFSDKCRVTVHEKNKEGVLVPVQKLGIYPFGVQTGLVDDEKLTDAMADYLINERKVDEYGRKYSDLIIEKSKK